MIELGAMTLWELSENIRLKRISAVEATRGYLERIRAHNGRVNAFVTVDEEKAVAAADEAQAEIQQGN